MLQFAKMLIHGNAWMAQQLELGQLSIAKLRKLFQFNSLVDDNSPHADGVALAPDTLVIGLKRQGKEGADLLSRFDNENCPFSAQKLRRTLPTPLFKEHGNALLFEPLS